MLKKSFIAVLVMLVIAGGVHAADAEFPLKKVVLFNSGVGYFQRAGTVTDDGEIRLRFRTRQINDVLKSLSLVDLDGGQVSVVSFASREPLSRILGSFSVNLSGNPPLLEVCRQLRGTPVVVTVGTDSYTGTILGVETRDHFVEKEKVTVPYLHLFSEKHGIRSFEMTELASVEFTDPDIQREVKEALKAISDSRRKDAKTVVVRYTGDGDHRLVAGYVLETPVWKTSYRLTLDDKEKPFLQGWAIVDNTQDEDWENVDLSLVSGLPISFIQDLYNPLYIDRPVYQPPRRLGVKPREYEGAVERKDKAPMASLGRKLRKRSIRLEGEASFADVEMMAPAAMAAPRAGAGVKSRAQSRAVGELFEYAIEKPVTIKRRRSAMIPIVNLAVEGEKISIYNEQSRKDNPLNGVFLENSTGLHLEAGPVTVFDGGSYAGDALLGNMQPGEKKLLSYAVDLACVVDPKSQSTQESIRSIKLINGVLTTENKSVSRKVYVIRNKAEKAKTVIVEHPIRSSWKLVFPKKADERTDKHYRFRVELKAGENVDFIVEEEHIFNRTFYLTDQPLHRVEYYLSHNRTSPAVARALRDVIKIRRKIDKIQQTISDLESKERTITVDQGRVRRNMGAVDRNSKLYKRYMQNLYDQEDELLSIRGQLEEKRVELEAEKRELADYLGKLSIN